MSNNGLDISHNASEKRTREKAYNREKVILSIVDMTVSIIFLGIWAFSGAGVWLEDMLPSVRNEYFRFFMFMLCMGISFSIVGLPLDYYSGFMLEHKYGLSNQSLGGWAIEKIKGSLVGGIIGIPLTMAFYFFLKITGLLWWLWFGIFAIVVSVLLARIAPVIIFPLFYKFKDIESSDIKERITTLLDKEGISINGIYSFNMSKDTKKANAGFAGIGRSKRIILSDTLIENFTFSEISVIFAHEMGHYTKRHIWKNLAISSALILASFFLCESFYSLTLEYLGFSKVYDLAALPILFFYLSLVGIFLMPAANAVSRRFEREADRYAIKITNDKVSFVSSMEKLADLNIADRNPHPAVVFFFYSHPAINQRIAFAEGILP